jgi:hypothetical protein
MRDATHAVITIQNGKVAFTAYRPNGSSSSEYLGCTVEELEDACRIVALQMDLHSSDPKRECQRIHADEQLSAFIRESIEEIEHDQR